MASERRSKVPASTSSWQRRSYSSAEPSHQWIASGWVSSAISSTQEISLDSGGRSRSSPSSRSRSRSAPLTNVECHDPLAGAIRDQRREAPSRAFCRRAAGHVASSACHLPARDRVIAAISRLLVPAPTRVGQSRSGHRQLRRLIGTRSSTEAASSDSPSSIIARAGTAIGQRVDDVDADRASGWRKIAFARPSRVPRRAYALLRVRVTPNRRAGRDPGHQVRLLHDRRRGPRGRRGIGGPVVIKSQVLTGGRMKAGGVKFADTPEEAEAHAAEILELEINGHMPRGVLVDPKAEVKQEYYAGVVWDGTREAAADALQRHGRDRHRGGRRGAPRPRRPRPPLQPACRSPTSRPSRSSPRPG